MAVEVVGGKRWGEGLEDSEMVGGLEGLEMVGEDLEGSKMVGKDLEDSEGDLEVVERDSKVTGR